MVAGLSQCGLTLATSHEAPATQSSLASASGASTKDASKHPPYDFTTDRRADRAGGAFCAGVERALAPAATRARRAEDSVEQSAALRLPGLGRRRLGRRRSLLRLGR